jgi:hypothetical protein
MGTDFVVLGTYPPTQCGLATFSAALLGDLPAPARRTPPPSTGALRHGDTVVLPYGCSDSSVRFATVDLPGLLRRLAHSQRNRFRPARVQDDVSNQKGSASHA